jgi:hypothetical protein
MIEFSMKVAFVIGKFKTEPKQAHFIVCLLNKDFVTPTVVIPKIRIVNIKADII